MPEQQSNMLNVHLTIDRTEYLLKVAPDDEETFRKAATLINSKLARYQERFPNQGSEKNKAFVMLDLATELLRQANRNDTQPYTAKLEELAREMEDVLGKK